MAPIDDLIASLHQKQSAYDPLIAAAQGQEDSATNALLNPQGMSPSNSIAESLVGLLPTLVAGALGGKRMAGDFATAGAGGIGLAQKMDAQDKENDLKKALYLGTAATKKRQSLQTAKDKLGEEETKAVSKNVFQEDSQAAAQEGREYNAGESMKRTLYVQGQANARHADTSSQQKRMGEAIVPPNFVEALAARNPDLKIDPTQPMTAQNFAQASQFAEAGQRAGEERRRRAKEISDETQDIEKSFKGATGTAFKDEAEAMRAMVTMLQNPTQESLASLGSRMARFGGEKGALATYDVKVQLPTNIKSEARKVINYWLEGHAPTVTEGQLGAVRAYLNNMAGAMKKHLVSQSENIKTSKGIAPLHVSEGTYEPEVDRITNSYLLSLPDTDATSSFSPEQKQMLELLRSGR